MKVIFPGSFDPLTNGHKSIVLKALNIFDSVDIVILNNINKNPAKPKIARAVEYSKR